MENLTSPTQQQNTTTALDSQVESWKIAVPLFLLLLVAVAATGAVLIVLYYYKKCYKKRAVLPVIVIDEIDTVEPSNYQQSTVQKSNSTLNIESSTSKKPSRLNLLSGLEDFDEEFRPTRTKSLTVLVPKDKKLSEIFGTKVDTGELREPDKMDGKWRWQISLLENIEKDQHSVTGSFYSDNGYEEEITETIYRQGVYMDWKDKLMDLRTAFINTKQIEREEAAFCFLWTDVLGERIEIESEKSICLNQLSRFVISSRTIYIEKLSQEAVQKRLCVCGKHASFQCTHCKNRGYCSVNCEHEDSDHVFYCSTNII